MTISQCDLYHWKRSTRDWKCYERIVEKYRPLRQRTVRAKLPRTRQGLYHRPFKRRNKIPPKWTCLRDLGTILTWRSTNRALQRQWSRSSYFRRWECDRCHIFWRLYRWRCEHQHTQKTTSLTERMNMLPQLRFLDQCGQFAPISAWISKVRLR